MIKLENICFDITKENKTNSILNNVSFCFEKGKINVITGTNGSGKSSLIKIIMGIYKQTSGNIYFDNKKINGLSINERANLGITLAFQQPIRFKGLIVKNLLDEASKKNNKLGDACEYLSKVGLCAKDYINRTLDETLSGGELKRIEIALSLVKGGEVFLFDEPEAGIDLWSFEELIKIFKELNDKTVIIVSHQKKILEIADNIIVLNRNEPLKYGTKEEILTTLNFSTSCAKLEGKYE